MAMKNPPHVGGVIRGEVIEPPSDMALRVEKAFGPKMEHLMRMQLAYDLAQARKKERTIRVKRYVVKKGAEHPGLSR